MCRNLTPEEIAGIAMFDYIINQGMAETIIDKMHAKNFLECVSYETIDNNQVEEIYTRELFLRGQRICASTRRYSYNEDEQPTLDYNVEEAATLEDLRDFLMYGDYSDLLVIAKEVGHQEAIRRDGPILSLIQ